MALIKGKWKWKSSLALPTGAPEYSGVMTEFTSNGMTFYGMDLCLCPGGEWVGYIDSSGINWVYDSTGSQNGGAFQGWQNEEYRTIDFGSDEIEVSDEFYQVLVNNAISLEIKLQPTDRCVLDYGTTVNYSNTTINQGIILERGVMSPIGEYLYKGSSTFELLDGEITSVSLYTNASTPSGATFSYSISEDKKAVTFSCRYSTINDYGSWYGATANAKISYKQTIENKREVFMICGDEGKILWRKHKPVYVVFDESQIFMVEIDETDNYTGSGGGVEFTESGEEGLIPTGTIWTVARVHCRDGYELDAIEFNGVVGTTIDLTDVANLTLNDFKEVEIAVHAKDTAAVDPTMREIDPTCIDEQAGEGYLNTRSVTTEIREYIDWDGEYSELEGPRGGDVFMAYDYLEDNEGKVVPVIYKTDYENGDVIDEGCPPDYQDQYFYVGQGKLNGVTYDKWRKIDGGLFTWEGDTKKYLYTNVITVDKALTILAPEILSATSFYREDTSDWRIEVEVGNPNEQAAQLFIFYQTNSEWHRTISTTISGLSQKTCSFTTASVSAGANIPIKAQLQIGDITSEETFGEVHINS